MVSKLHSESDSNEINRLKSKIKELENQILASEVSNTKLQKNIDLQSSRFNFTMNLANYAWWEIDVKTGAVEFDRRKTDLLGYPAEDFKHYSDFTDLVHPEDYQQMMDAMIKLYYENAEFYDCYYRIKTASGEYKRFHDVGKVSKFSDEGKPLTVRGIIIDIVDDLNFTKLQIYNELSLKNLIDNHSAIMLLIDPESGIIYYANKAAEKFYMYSLNHLIGMNINQINTIKDFNISYYAKLLSEKKQNVFIFEHKLANSEIKIVEVHSSNIIINQKNFLFSIVTDITERIIAEEAIKKSEASLLQAQELAQMGSWHFDLIENKLTVSENLQKLYGFQNQEVDSIVDFYKKLILPDDVNLLEQTVLKVIETQFTVSTEMKIVREDGEIRWFQNNISPEIINGNVIAINGANIDITDLKNAEIENKNLNRIYSLLSNVNQAIVRSVDENRLFSDICEIGIREGKFRFIWIGVHNEIENKIEVLTHSGEGGDYLDGFSIDLNDEEAKKGPTGRAFLSGKYSSSNYIDMDNKMLPWREKALNNGFHSSICLPLKIKGEVTALLNIYSNENSFFNFKEINLLNNLAIDISYALEYLQNERNKKFAELELQASEARLNEAQRIAKIGNWELNFITNILYWSNEIYRIFDINKSEFNGTYIDFISLIHPEDQEMVNDLFKISLETKKSFDIVHRVLTKDGNIKYVHQQCETHFDFENNPRISIGTAQDVTKEVISEQKLLISIAQAEESDNLKTAFLQNISHEIRTPLNGIIGFSNLLQDEEITKEEIAEYTDVIKKSGNRLIEIVNNVLDISKIETGQLDVQLSKFSINKLVTDLYNFFVESVNRKGIEFDYNNEFEDVYAQIETDKSIINQVLTNLINNSIKFTNNGKISFGYEIQDEYLKFYVKDTGIGIPENMKYRIFMRFAQVNLDITRGYEGAGIGLSICKGLVELIGGKIWFESKENEGTEFYFTIPLKSRTLIKEKTEENIRSIAPVRRLKILIAEDDLVSYQYLSKLLLKNDCEVIYAENGLKAVEYIKNYNDIDIVLMDIRMPEMDGLEATRTIKELKPHIPIVAQTAYGYFEEKEKFLSVGCDDFISKPIQPKEIYRILEKYSK
jgi:PAS domain S-box-containing protein